MQNSHKQKKSKSKSNNNSSHSSSNNSNISDENKNSLNNSANAIKEKNVIQTQNEQEQHNNKSAQKINQLKNLKYIFPFFPGGEQKEEDNKNKNYSISEYNKIVSSINQNNNINDKNKYEEDILEGKINIIDKIIQIILQAIIVMQVMKIKIV